MKQKHKVDHACAECGATQDLVVDGFRCDYHEAKAKALREEAEKEEA